MAIDYGSMYGSANDVQGFGIGNAPVNRPNPFPVFNKPSPAPVTTISYNPPTGPVGNAPIISKPFPTLKPPTSRPTGSLSFSFGGGGGGGSSAPVPSNVLTPQTFAPYESTYTPPTPATPIPYDYATRDPYFYGDGLSNAGAAYDIWGSKPGTNPYLLTTPDSYTPGILGLDPVTLPGNMPNKGANISAFTPAPAPVPRTPEQIVRSYGYTDRLAPMQNNVPPSMRDSAPNAGVMLAAAAKNVSSGIYPNMKAAMDAQVAFSKKYPATSPAENKRLIAESQKMLLSQDQRPKVEKKTTRPSSIPKAGTGASGPAGGAAYAAKKTSTKAAVKKYTTKTVNNSFSARRDVRNLFA